MDELHQRVLRLPFWAYSALSLLAAGSLGISVTFFSAAGRVYLWITGVLSLVVLIPVLVSHALYLRRVRDEDLLHAEWKEWAVLVSLGALSLVVAGLSTGSVRAMLVVYALLAVVWAISSAARATR